VLSPAAGKFFFDIFLVVLPNPGEIGNVIAWKF
jgi:hypothetical protein